jgi:hypothetical protein
MIPPSPLRGSAAWRTRQVLHTLTPAILRDLKNCIEDGLTESETQAALKAVGAVRAACNSEPELSFLVFTLSGYYKRLSDGITEFAKLTGPDGDVAGKRDDIVKKLKKSRENANQAFRRLAKKINGSASLDFSNRAFEALEALCDEHSQRFPELSRALAHVHGALDD